MPVITTDPLDALPIGEPRRKLIALRQRSADARAVWLPISDDIRAVRLDRQRAETRLNQLKLRRGQGGPDLDDSDPQVIDVKKTIARCESELSRLQTLESHRGAVMHITGQLVQRVEDWLRSGRPQGTQLTQAPAIESDIMRKGERAADALDRHRSSPCNLLASARLEHSTDPIVLCPPLQRQANGPSERLRRHSTPEVPPRRAVDSGTRSPSRTF
jgi:hypothetical protein